MKTEEGGKDGEQERLPVRTAGTSVSHKSTPIVIVGVKVFFLFIFVYMNLYLCALILFCLYSDAWKAKPTMSHKTTPIFIVGAKNVLYIFLVHLYLILASKTAVTIFFSFFVHLQ